MDEIMCDNCFGEGIVFLNNSSNELHDNFVSLTCPYCMGIGYLKHKTPKKTNQTLEIASELASKAFIEKMEKSK